MTTFLVGLSQQEKCEMAGISVTCADGRPLSELAKLIEQRAKWLNETAEQSCTATMLDVLVSIRALTAIAKPSKKEIKITTTSLTPSFTGGRNNPTFCLRNGTMRYTPKRNQRIGRTSWVTNDILKVCKVYMWHDIKDREWLIVAVSENDARDWALNKIQKRARRFKGLARTALSLLMMKSGSKTS